MLSPPSADARDVASLDAIIAALYGVISGPAGQPRDWTRYRSLFLPETRFLLAVIKQGEAPRVRMLDVEAFIRRVEPIFQKEDFWEVETERKTEVVGHVAHVLSHYESRHQENGPAFTSGANSMQLFFDGTRWWFASVMWNTERG
jgi:hypothetical protein